MHLGEHLDLTGLRRAAPADPVDQLRAANRANAARRALAAAFRRAEFKRETRHCAHVGVLIEHADPTVTDQRVSACIGFIVKRQIELAGRNIGSQWPADLHRLHRAARCRAAADRVYQLAQRDAESRLEQSAVPHIPGKLDRDRPARTLDAVARIMLRSAVCENMRHGGERQHIVDHRGATKQPFQRRQRRLGAHFPALALKAVQQRRLLAADIGPRPHPHFDVQRRQPIGGKHDCRIQLGDGERVFAAHIDKGFLGPHRMAGDGHAFEQVERIAFHQHPVGEGRAVALVGVADDIFLRARRSAHGLPLDPGGKPRPASPAQARSDHFGDHVIRRHGARALQPRPAPGCGIVVETERPRFAGARESQPLLAGDEGMLSDGADGQGRSARQDRRHIIDTSRTEAQAIDLGQRLEPVHPPRRHPLDRAAGIGESRCQRIGAARQRQCIVADPHNSHADCTSRASTVSSSRACKVSPTRALGPALHSPRQ